MFDTSNVTSIRDMFYDCGNLMSIDLSNFDLKSFNNANPDYPISLFDGCVNLKTIKAPYTSGKNKIIIQLPETTFYDQNNPNVNGIEYITNNVERYGYNTLGITLTRD